MPITKGIGYLLGTFALFGAVVSVFPLHAQEVTAVDVANRRAELQATLDQIEKEIKEQQNQLQVKQSERRSLERDVGILTAQIKTAQLNIKARDIGIQKLVADINDKQRTIGSLNSKLDREKQSLAQILRKTEESDRRSMVELILSNQSIGDFFTELDSYDSVKLALQSSFEVIADTRTNTEAAKESLEQKKEQENELRALQVLEQKKIQEQEREKQKIVNDTKGQEAVYQKLIATKEKTAAQIRAELFALRDSAAIPFGKAVEYATEASKVTGVRPALVLGVLKQETRLGENLGTGSWNVDMHPTRDRPLYQVITATLGLDPNQMPVSKKPSYGWGGAMGPAQFIPSTWACYGGYINTRTGDCGNTARTITMTEFWAGPWVYDASKDRLRKLLGKGSPSNPWEAEDAIMASSALMADNGAAKGGRSAERLAALRYFAGWVNASNPNYAFYGDGVMEHADYFQSQIDILGGS